MALKAAPVSFAYPLSQDFSASSFSASYRPQSPVRDSYSHLSTPSSCRQPEALVWPLQWYVMRRRCTTWWDSHLMAGFGGQFGEVDLVYWHDAATVLEKKSEHKEIYIYPVNWQAIWSSYMFCRNWLSVKGLQGLAIYDWVNTKCKPADEPKDVGIIIKTNFTLIWNTGIVILLWNKFYLTLNWDCFRHILKLPISALRAKIQHTYWKLTLF